MNDIKRKVALYLGIICIGQPAPDMGLKEMLSIPAGDVSDATLSLMYGRVADLMADYIDAS